MKNDFYLSERQTKIFSMIKNNPDITREEIAESAGIALRTVSRELDVLKKLYDIEYDKTQKRWNL